jgi:hypothetical protein
MGTCTFLNQLILLSSPATYHCLVVYTQVSRCYSMVVRAKYGWVVSIDPFELSRYLPLSCGLHTDVTLLHLVSTGFRS